MLTAIPLLVITLIVYNVFALTGDPGGMDAFLARGVDFTMFSGELWRLTIGDALIAVSLILLFIEIVKSTSTGAASIINHGLSFLVLAVGIIEFVTMTGFATSTFFLLILMQTLDVVAGFTITIVAAKRDLGVAPGVIGTN